MHYLESDLAGSIIGVSPSFWLEPWILGPAVGLGASFFFFLGLSFRSRRKALLKELQSSEERYRTLVSNIPGAVYRCACDANWTMEIISTPIKEICGYPASDFIDNRVRSFASIIHPDDARMVQETVMKGISQKQPYIIEYRVMHADGSVRWVYEKGQGVFDESGAVKWLDGVIFDATQRKRVEQELRQSHDLLEVRVQERTEELVRANESLRKEIHERRKAERALRESEERLSAIINNTPQVAVQGYDLDGRVLFWSKAAERVFGWLEEEALGKTLDQLILDENATRQFVSTLHEINESNQPFGPTEWCFVGKHGVEGAVYSTIFPIPKADGGKEFICMDVDVTEQKRALEKEREAEQRLRRQDRALVELAKGEIADEGDLKKALRKITETAAHTLEVERTSIWLFDEGRSRIGCADLYERSLDRHSGGVELSCSDYPFYFNTLHEGRVIPASDAKTDPRTREFLESYLLPLGITSILDAPVRLEGQVVGIIWHEHVGKPRDWTSEDQYFAASIADFISLALETSQRKQAEKSLREQQNLLRSIIEGTDDRVFAKDCEGRYELMNSSEAKDVGKSLHEILGLTDRDLYPPEVAERIMETDRRIISTGDSQSYEQDFDTVDRGIRTYLVTKYPRFDQNNRVIGVLGIAHDITERKQAEAERLAAKQRLQHLMSSSPATIYSCGPGPEFPTTFIADNVSTQLGYSPQQFYDDPFFWTKKIHQKDVDRVLGELARIDQGEKVSYEYRFLHQEGHYIWLHDEVTPTRDQQGRVNGLVGSWFDITDRKLAGRELEKQRAFLRKVIDINPNFIFAKDRQGRFTLVNQAVADLYGTSVEELLGKTDGDFNPNADQVEFFRRVDREVMDSQEERRITEEVVTDAREKMHWLQTVKCPIVDDDGVANQVLGVATDVTDLKRAEEALRRARDGLEKRVQERTVDLEESNRRLEKEIAERKLAEEERRKSEERLQSILDNTTAVIYVKDIDGKYVLINHRFEELFHMARDHLVGKTDYDIFPREAADAFRVNDRKAIEMGQAIESEETVPQDDGIHTYISIKFPLRDPDGLIYAVCGISTDISERKRAEETVKTLAKFPDENPAPILRIAKDGKILYANAISAPLLSSWNCRVGEKLPEPWYGTVVHTLHCGTNQDLEVTCGQRVYSMIFTPIVEGGYVNLYANDITRSKLAEEQLRQAQKMEAVGTLASGIAHEFRSLLTAISIHTDSAKESLPDDHPAVRTLEKVEETARHARGVTNSLLTFSHRAVIKKLPVNLSRNLQETVRLLRRLLPTGIEIEESICSNQDLWVLADAVQLQQILMNLALNSRDAMPNGGWLCVSLRAELDEATGKHHEAVLMVEDSGCGMPESVKTRVFEPFFTTKSPGQGTGLGMSLILNIVQDMSGTIDIQSRPRRGTQIIITLPCCEPPREAPEEEHREQGFRGQGERILVIEQNQHIRSIMTSTLRSDGYEPMPVPDVQSALTIVADQQQSADLLIIDLDLLNDSDLSRLRELTKLAVELPLVLLAGTISINLAKYEMEKAFLLRKPFQMAKLASVVANCLSNLDENGRNQRE